VFLGASFGLVFLWLSVRKLVGLFPGNGGRTVEGRWTAGLVSVCVAGTGTGLERLVLLGFGPRGFFLGWCFI
jgi:hypothetical protein